jgi:hypothetical protein
VFFDIRSVKSEASNWAEDPAQEAFVEASCALPKLREPAAFGAWLRTILCKHCWFNHPARSGVAQVLIKERGQLSVFAGGFDPNVESFRHGGSTALPPQFAYTLLSQAHTHTATLK